MPLRQSCYPQATALIVGQSLTPLRLQSALPLGKKGKPAIPEKVSVLNLYYHLKAASSPSHDIPSLIQTRNTRQVFSVLSLQHHTRFVNEYTLSYSSLIQLVENVRASAFV
jgi:hypothetical protein